MDQPGSFGRYTVKKTLGKGAMGVVYLAEDPVIGREVAIKVILTPTGAGEDEAAEAQARFEREFRTAGTLSHPNIVTIHDVGQEEGNTFIAMEYVRGESLQDVLASDQVLSFKDVSDLAFQLCSGLDYAHERGIVHRDIKPANILITRDGQAKITDFGVAKLATTTLTRTGTIIGTPAYMSPEQVQGHPATPASDQFSVAILVYEMLTGELPFAGDSPTTIMYKIVHEQPIDPHELNKTLPEQIDRVLARALDKSAEKRFESCTEFADAIRDALGAAPPDTTIIYAPPEKKGVDRKPLWIGGAAAFVVALAAGWLIFAGLDGDDAGDPAAADDPAQVEESLRGDPAAEAEPAGDVEGDGSDRSPADPQTADAARPEQTTVGDETPEAGDVGAGEQEPPPPEPVTYSVTSAPEGATVVLDGETVGITPVEIELLPETEYRLFVELEGYEAQSYAFSLEELSADAIAEGRLRFPLTADAPPGVVSVTAPYPVRVVVDGDEREAATDHRIELVPGSHEVEVTAPDVFYRRRETLEVASEETIPIEVPPAHPIQVIATPVSGVCKIFIDGRDAGFAPLNGILVSEGEHEFRFEWSRPQEVTKTSIQDVFRDNQRIQENIGGGGTGR